MSTKGSLLGDALFDRVKDYRSAIDLFRDKCDSESDFEALRTLREAVDLTNCLRRMLDKCDDVPEIHRAFGAPGDFGYDTKIGDALERIYRGGT